MYNLSSTEEKGIEVANGRKEMCVGREGEKAERK
jgi:hypothetical protein